MASKRKRVEPKNVKRSGIDPKKRLSSAPDGLYDPHTPIEELALQMNRAVEELVRAHPEQYLWGYDRHKQPREGD